MPPEDYGVDGIVELFEDGTTTGLRFNVQLKGTAAELPGAWTRTIRYETFSYWASLNEPVLLVCYHQPTNEIRAMWAGWRLGTQRSEGFAFKFTSDMQLAEIDRAATVGYLRAVQRLNRELPAVIPVDIRSETPLIPAVEARAAILAAGELLGIRLSHEPSTQAIASLTVHAAGIDADPGFNPIGMGLPEGRPITETEWPTAAVGTLCLALAENGRTSVLANYLAAVGGAEFLAGFVGANVPTIASTLVKAGRVRLASELGKRLAEQEALDEAALLCSAVLAIADDQAPGVAVVTRFLSAQSPDDAEVEATMHLSLAAVKSTSDPSAALERYSEALRVKPELEHEDWFHHRRGAALFFAQRASEAEVAYRTAQALRHDPNRQFLIADCLMFDGQFRMSRRQFCDAIDSSQDEPEPEWLLKHLLLNSLTVADGRDPIEAQRVLESPGQSNGAKWKRALEADPLCEVAAFNIGVDLSRKGHDATTMFLIPALVNLDDAESWVNVIISASNTENDAVATLAARCALQHCESEYVAYVRDNYDGDLGSMLLQVASFAAPPTDEHDSVPMRIRTLPLSGASVQSAINTPAVSHKVGRNTRCPCGSGAKWKHCHGANRDHTNVT